MKQFARRTALIFFVRAFPSAAAAVCAIIFSRKLPQAEYGAYQQFWSQVLLMASLAGIGLQSLLITLPAAEAGSFFSGSKRPRNILAFAVLVSGVILLLLQTQFSLRMALTAISLMATLTLTAIGEALLFHQGKFRLLAILNGLYALAFIGLHLLVVGGYCSPTQLYTGILMLALLKLGIMLQPVLAAPDMAAGVNPMPKATKRLWAHLAVYDATQATFRWVDKVTLAILLPPAAFAVYFNGTYDVPLLPLLLGAAGSAMLLHFSKGANTLAEQVQMQYRAASVMCLIVFPVFFFLAVFRVEIFTVILSPKYTDAASLFLVAILVLPLRTYNFTTLLQHAGKGRIINTGALADLLIAILLMYPLYLVWGLRGVALSFVISTYFQAGYYLYHTSKLTGIRAVKILPLRRLAIAFILFGISYILFYYGLSILFSPAIVLLLASIVTGIVVIIPVLGALYRK